MSFLMFLMKKNAAFGITPNFIICLSYITAVSNININELKTSRREGKHIMKINIGNKHLTQSGDPDYLKDYIYEECRPAKETFSYSYNKKNRNEYKWIIQIGISAIILLLIAGLFKYNLPFTAPVKSAVKYLLNTDTNIQPVFHKILQLATQSGNIDWPMVDDVPKTSGKATPAGVKKETNPNSAEAETKGTGGKTKSKEEEDMVLPVSGKVVGMYGWSAKPGEEIQEFNEGIDIEVKAGTKVRASSEGEVIKTGKDERLGKYLVIKTPSGIMMRYSNLSQIITEQGQKVETGEIIAKTGYDANNKAKLHFEIIIDGKPVNPLDKLGVDLEESGVNGVSGE